MTHWFVQLVLWGFVAFKAIEVWVSVKSRRNKRRPPARPPAPAPVASEDERDEGIWL